MMLFGLLPWFCLMAAGLVVSVLLIIWGHTSGQFADQERARYLPLRGEEITVPDSARRRGIREVRVLVAFIVMTGVTLAACLTVALIRHYGG